MSNKPIKNIIIKFILLTLVVFSSLSVILALSHKHQNTSTLTKVEATCDTYGLKEVVCNECGKVIDEIIIKKVEHKYSEYKIIKKPTEHADGIKSRTCLLCKKEVKISYTCKHNKTKKKITKNSSCKSKGIEEERCIECNKLINKKELELIDHIFEVYQWKVYPCVDKNGILIRTCKNCDYTEEKEFICKHEHLETITIKNATCKNNGKAVKQCSLCKKQFDEISIQKTKHIYSDWNIIKHATPLNKGIKEKSCIYCKHKIQENINFHLSGNYLYIPGKIGINFVISGFSQEVIDTYDVIYTEDAVGYNEPFIYGHAYRTMGTFLSSINVGDIIYVSINNKIRVFQAVVSEYAVKIDNGYNFLGLTTGAKLYDSIGDVTLHMYTCHGSDPNGRWFVLAKYLY